MTEPTTTTCRYCKKPADDQDGLCSVCRCRAEAACTELTEHVTDALETFLDARFSPHNGPTYFPKSPAYDEDAPEQTEIAAACEQLTTGVKRLIELALGRKVRMIVGPWPDFYDPYDGWEAYLFTTTEGREVILGTSRSLLPRSGGAADDGVGDGQQ